MPPFGGMATKKPAPYWLSGGTEICDVCSQPHLLQAQRRCAACDAGVCEHCVVTSKSGEVFCVPCRSDAEEG